MGDARRYRRCGVAQVRHSIADTCASRPMPRREVEIDPRLASLALSHLLENAAQYSQRIARSSVDATCGR